MRSQSVGHDLVTKQEQQRTFILIGAWQCSAGKESSCNAGNPSLIPGSGRSTGERIGYPLQYFGASLVTQLVKNPPAMQETWVQSLGGKILWRRERLPTPVFWPGEFHGLYNPWGCKESDTTEWLSLNDDISSDLNGDIKISGYWTH